MPAVPISGSPNITSLDSRIYADLCGGNFLVDVTPSVFLPGGNGTSGGVQGASVQITNPVGVIFKQYPTSGYDINPPMTGVCSVAIPLIAGNYQYGNYTVNVRLTDEDGTTYTVSKSVNICPPDPHNKTKKEGCLSATIKGNCQDGKVVILLNQPPNYKGTAFTSQVNDLTLEYPTASGLPELDTTFGSFSVALYEGQYKLTGNTCVLYSYGDYVYFKVKYKISYEKIIRCIVDECCVQAKLDELRLKTKTDCTQVEKDTTFSIILEAIGLLKMAELAADCGEDPSDIIGDMEKLLGCVCTCNCNEGTPIIDNTPAKDFSIEGCGVEKTTVGLTDIYDINVYNYSLVNDDTSGILSVGAVITDGCTKKQHINISRDAIISQTGYVYRGLLTQSGGSNPTAVVDSYNTVTITWTRQSAGTYLGTLSGSYTPLTKANTFLLSSPNANFQMKANYTSASTITVQTANITTDVPTDSLLDATPLQLSILS